METAKDIIKECLDKYPFTEEYKLDALDDIIYENQRTGICESDPEHNLRTTFIKATERYINRTMSGSEKITCTECGSKRTRLIQCCMYKQGDPMYMCKNCGNKF